MSHPRWPDHKVQQGHGRRQDGALTCGENTVTGAGGKGPSRLTNGYSNLEQGPSPGRLQHHDSVLPLKGAGWGEGHVNVGEPTAVRIAVPAASHPTGLDGGVRGPAGEGLQPGGERVQLQGKPGPSERLRADSPRHNGKLEPLSLPARLASRAAGPVPGCSSTATARALLHWSPWQGATPRVPWINK